MSPQFSKVEHEIIILKSIWEMIDEMVNYSLFANTPRNLEAELRFKSAQPKNYSIFI
jgi:hypothetical protein